MRHLALVALLVTTAAWSVDKSRRTTLGTDEARGLTQEQVEHYAGSYFPAVRACYLDHARGAIAATGRLEIRATVLRGGTVIGLSIQAPGVIGERLATLAACIQTEVDTWHFPVRRDDTMIVLPYYFQRLVVPGAGPQYSCWNPRGCYRRR